MDKKTGIYEKKVKLKADKKGKQKEITIKAVGLENMNEEGNVVGRRSDASERVRGHRFIRSG